MGVKIKKTTALVFTSDLTFLSEAEEYQRQLDFLEVCLESVLCKMDYEGHLTAKREGAHKKKKVIQAHRSEDGRKCRGEVIFGQMLYLSVGVYG